MNEKIKELAIKSELLYEDKNTHISYSNDYTEDELEKFAKLIIEECVRQCLRKIYTSTETPVHNNAVYMCVNAIKNKFDISEKTFGTY
jgi:hypothetical protein